MDQYVHYYSSVNIVPTHWLGVLLLYINLLQILKILQK
jgi:hypothetical protein